MTPEADFTLKRNGGQQPRRIVRAGYFMASTLHRELSRLIGDTTEIVMISSTDYFLYLPLMPQVAGEMIEP